MQEAAISFEEDARYPTSFAINGNTLITRAYQHPNNYQSPDSKTPYKRYRNYVYAYTGKTWLQQAELIIPEEKPGTGYNLSNHLTAIDGDTILVGANVFTRSGETWSLTTKLQPPSLSNLEMGQSIALNGDTAVIGTENTIHVFRRNPDTGDWFFETEIRRDRTPLSHFPLGKLAIIDGDTVTDGFRVYRRSSTNDWLPEAELTLNGKPIRSILNAAISGNTIVLGKYTRSDDVDTRGSAHVFERNSDTGAWEYKKKLVPHDIPSFAIYGFGSRIAIEGNIIVAGYGFDIRNKLHYALNWWIPKPKGRAYIFVKNKKGRWLRSATLRPNNKEKATGGSVKISGNRVIFSGRGDRKLYIYKRVD